MKLFEAIARSLADLEVGRLFGLIGDANLFMVDAYIRKHGGAYTAAVHEAGVVLMALGYARVSGEIGVATVTHGPALTNTLTALIEGVKTATPIVLLAGDTPVADREHAQNINQREFVMATGAGFEQLRAPATLADDLARTFFRARQERRPVVLNMPIEFMWQEVEYTAPRVYFPESRSVISSSTDMDNAIGIIASSRLPVVIGGRGAADPDAEAAIQRLARRIEAPVATTVRGKGLFADDPFNLGICGTIANPVAMETLGAADCLIVFGASLNQYTAGLGGLTRGKRIVHVETAASQIGRFTPVDAGLVGDLGLTAEAMLKWIDEAEIPGSGARNDDLLARLDAMRGREARFPRKPRPGAVDLLEALQALDRSFPEDRVYVSDTGRFLVGAWPLVRVRNPRDYVDTIGFAAIGLGLATAIGAAKAADGRPTLLVTGDGGFMLGGVSELATAMREQLDLTIVVCNDGGYGAEYIQYAAREMDPSLSLQQWPDLADVARGFGLEACSVTSSEELRAAMQGIAGGDRKGPRLIDIRIDPACMPIGG